MLHEGRNQVVEYKGVAVSLTCCVTGSCTECITQGGWSGCAAAHHPQNRAADTWNSASVI
jgi:hypothetical protein